MCFSQKVASLKSKTDAAAIPAALKADLRAKISQLEVYKTCIHSNQYASSELKKKVSSYFVFSFYQDQLRKAKKKIGEENIHKAIKAAMDAADAAVSQSKAFCLIRVNVGLDTTAVREAVLKVVDQKVNETRLSGD